jgi:photosystem II stability/assembly factor-like uncharacterized protein
MQVIRQHWILGAVVAASFGLLLTLGAVVPGHHAGMPATTGAPIRCAATPPCATESAVATEATITRGLAGASLEDADEGETNGLDAMHERWLARLDDDGEIKPGALLAAKAESDALPELTIGAEQRDAGIWSWTSFGPGNIGGRVRAICFTSNSTIYVGGVSGGVWKSTDTGGTWTPLTDFIASLAITSIVVDPGDANHLFASTGEGFGGGGGALPGAGVFETTDAGDTWRQIPPTANWTYTNRLAFGVFPGETYLFAATDSGLWRSPLGTDNWFQVLPNANALDVKVNGARVLVGGAANAWLSTAYGNADSFVQLTTGEPNMLPNDTGRCEMAFGANNVMWASLDRNNGEVWASFDGGTTWVLRNTGLNYLCKPDNPDTCQGMYDNAIWASFDDPALVVIGGAELWRSTSYGLTFTQINNGAHYFDGTSAHGDQHAIVPPPDYGPSNRRLYFGNDGGVQSNANIYTADQDFGWTNHANHLGITQFYGGATEPSGSYVIGGTQDVGTNRYTPSGGPSAWTHVIDSDGGHCAINYLNPVFQFGEIQHLGFKRSLDFGQTFSPATTGLTEAGDENLAPFVAPFAIDPTDPTKLVAGATSVWHTSDSATSWNAIRGPTSGSPKCRAVAIAATNSNRVWVGYSDGRVSRTTNGLTNWIDLDDNGPLPDRTVTYIAINPNDASEVFVTFGGYRTDTVWYTNDAGAAWQLRTGSGDNTLPAVQVNTITYHPLNTNWIYVGTDLGVYASEDKGLTWNRTPRFGNVDNDGPVNTEAAELFWQGTDYLVAATFGRGMWKTRPMVTVYVDKANNGFEDGSAAHPYNTVQEGIAAAGNGTTISIQAGDYNESGTTTFFKHGRVVATNGIVRIH